MPKTLLEWARYYKAKGFSVIPLSYKDKKPLMSWKEYQNRIANDEELQKWFGGTRHCNIGIVTGKISGIIVIDLDNEEAVQYAKKMNFLISPMVKTAKGFHVYRLYREGVRNFQKRDDLPGIDLRGEGGYVVAPPSVHPNGHQYVWEEGRSLEDVPLAEFPEIILAKTNADKTPQKVLYKGTSEGNRNDTLARLAGSWVRDDLTLDECLENALIWNEKNNPPLSHKELERTVKSIYERHYIKSEITFDNFDITKALRTGKELQVLDNPVKWAVKGLLPLESITLLPAGGGMGKTILSIDLANTVSRGIPFLGLETIQKPAVYIDFENSLPVLIDRIRRIGASEVMFWHASNNIKPPRLDSPEWVFYKKLPQEAVLIFDTLRASQSKDENDSQHMAFVMQRLKELRDCGFTILLLHHTPKANNQTYKGSTAIFDLSDHVLSLNKVRKGTHTEVDDDSEEYCYRLGTKDKTRYEPFQIFIEFDPVKGIFISAPDPDIQKLVEIYQLIMGKGPLNQSQICEIVKDELSIKSKESILKLLKKGEGKYWKVLPGCSKNSKIYSLLSCCPAMNSGDNTTTDMTSCPDNWYKNNQKTSENTELSVVQEGIKTTETNGNFSCPSNHKKDTSLQTAGNNFKIIPLKRMSP